MPEPTKQTQEIYEDEIDLREYINVIIKRKKIILTVFFISVIATAIVSFLMPKVYEVSMIIEPPIISVTNTGVQNLDSVENIRAKIEEGAFNKIIIEDLKLQENKLKFKLSQPKDTRLIKVSLEREAKKTDLGIAILNKLLKELSLNYAKFIEDKKSEFDHQIAIVTGQISTKENEINLKDAQFKIQEDREQKLLNEIKDTKDNSEKLLAERSVLLEKRSGKDDIASLLYTTTIHQNISYFSQLQNELTNIKVEKENIKTETKNLKNDINDLKIEIEKLNIVKNEIRNIGLIQEPQVSLYSIKKLNVKIAGMVSLMFCIFLALFMEYWEKSNPKIS